jgi:hypothetical protein
VVEQWHALQAVLLMDEASNSHVKPWDAAIALIDNGIF